MAKIFVNILYILSCLVTDSTFLMLVKAMMHNGIGATRNNAIKTIETTTLRDINESNVGILSSIPYVK